MKRMIAGLLTGIMAVSAMQSAFAAEEWLTYGDGNTSIRYSTYTGSVKRPNGPSSTEDHASPVNVKTVSISIPTKINGTEIVAVEKAGFVDFDELGAIELPATLTTLGEQAFAGADNLAKIELPDKLTAVSKACFKSCDSLSSVKFGKAVASVEDQAFYSCKSLKSVALNSSCKSVGVSAFELCSSLATATLPNSLESLGGSAFKDCSALTGINIPAKVTKIEANTFSGCRSLKTVNIAGNITSIGKNAFKDCGELADIYIPASCKKIEENAFDGCKKLRIHCDKGSAAESFAVANKYTYVNDRNVNSAIADPASVPDKITVTLDGRELNFNGVEPQIIKGSTMVPMRTIFEELGCIMNWDANTKTVTASRNVTTIKLTVNMNRAYINNKEYMLDSPPCIVNGSTLVPVRFVSEALGVEVRWDAANRTVSLVSK